MLEFVNSLQATSSKIIMKIKIVNLSKTVGTKLVDFETAIGKGTALWVGEEPIIGKFYDVEIDVGDDLIWGINIIMTPEISSMIAVKDNLFYLVAKVISSEEEGCISVKLGDSVVLLEIERAPTGIFGMVECKAKNVRLYPTNL